MTVQERLSPGKYLLSVTDYELLSASGAFGDARTELVKGDVVVMAPEFRPHAFVRDELAWLLRNALRASGSEAEASSGSIRVSETDMPQPDIVITSEPQGEGPIPIESVFLVVEVSSTTLQTDLGQKALLYAAAGIPEYWVADVNGRVIHQLWQPAPEGYGARRTVAFGSPVAAETLPSLAVATATL